MILCNGRAANALPLAHSRSVCCGVSRGARVDDVVEQLHDSAVIVDVVVRVARMKADGDSKRVRVGVNE